MSATKLKVLIVDDEVEFSDQLTYMVEPRYTALTAQSAEQALPLIREHASELVCIICDYMMHDMNGMDLRRQLLKDYKDIPFILMSGHISREDALAAIDVKISAFESKPFDEQRFSSLVTRIASERESTIQERILLEQTFIEEASGICEDLEPLIMSLETNPSDMEAINTVFRLVHTIKGSSGVLESSHIRRYVHRYEDLLAKIKSGQVTASPDIVSILLQGFDVVAQMVFHLKSGTAWQQNVDDLVGIFDVASQGAVSKEPSDKVASVKSSLGLRANTTKESVSVPTAMLDEFMEQSGEITVIRNMVNKLVRVIEKEQPGNRSIQHLSELLDEMHKINGVIQGHLSEVRKVSCTKVFRPLPRIVRDTAAALGKKVLLTISGEDTRVDTSIAKVLSDSMTHIVRNSLDHGIEMPEKRTAKGKKADGSITIVTREQNDEIIVTIEDDGAGLNTERIKRKALEKGLISESGLAEMTEKQVFGLIFESGFSTAEKITDVSGRGVGMDMVRSSVHSLRGVIDIESVPDQGTKFHLHIPIPKSVLIIDSLSVVAASQFFAIPQERITRLICIDGPKASKLIHALQGGFSFQFEGKLIPIVDLGAVLKLRPRDSIDYLELEAINLLVIRVSDGYFALFVDSILDSEEIVVKSAGKHLELLKVYMGATFMADGNVGLILDTDGLAAIAEVSTLNAKVANSTATNARLTAAPVIAADYLVFELYCRGKFAVPLQLIHRLEELPRAMLQSAGGRVVAIYREKVIPMIDLSIELGLGEKNLSAAEHQDPLSVFIVQIEQRFIGFIIRSVCDIASVMPDKVFDLSDRPQIAGTLEVSDAIVSVVNLAEILRNQNLGELVKGGCINDMRCGPGLDKREEIANSLSHVDRVSGENTVVEVECADKPDEAAQGWGLF